MPCYSNENLFFTTDIELFLLIVLNKVGLIPLPSHPGFPSNAILTAEVSYSWATPARKKQFLLLLPLSSHHSNKKLRATVFIGIQNRTGSKTTVVVSHNDR